VVRCESPKVMPPCTLELLSSQDSDQLAAYGLAVVSLRLVERSHVVRVTLSESLPQLHHSFGFCTVLRSEFQ